MRELFLDILKDVVPDITLLGLHSLRSGGASQASRSGISDRLIKKHGRWVSETAKNLYIRESIHEKNEGFTFPRVIIVYLICIHVLLFT